MNPRASSLCLPNGGLFHASPLEASGIEILFHQDFSASIHFRPILGTVRRSDVLQGFVPSQVVRT